MKNINEEQERNYYYKIVEKQIIEIRLLDTSIITENIHFFKSDVLFISRIEAFSFYHQRIRQFPETKKTIQRFNVLNNPEGEHLHLSIEFYFVERSSEQEKFFMLKSSEHEDDEFLENANYELEIMDKFGYSD